MVATGIQKENYMGGSKVEHFGLTIMCIIAMENTKTKTLPHCVSVRYERDCCQNTTMISDYKIMVAVKFLSKITTSNE